MVGKKVFASTAFLASILAVPANAQKVLLLPGMGSTVNTFTVEPFAAAAPVEGATEAFTIVAHPSGNRYFIVTRSDVRVVDNAGISVQEPVAVGLPILAAAITPDGGKLLVAAGTPSSGSLYIFNVSGGTMSQTGVVTTGANPTSVTGSMDSSRAFVLTAEGLTGVDLGTNTAGTTISLTVTSALRSKVVLGPNGLLYVNANRSLYEINADSMTIRRAIAVAGFPNPPTFTQDGATALIANPDAGVPPQPGLLMLDLKTYTIKSIATLPGVHFTKLIPANSRANAIYALASQFAGLFQLRPDLSGVTGATLPGVGIIDNVVSAFTSAELPNSSGVVGPKYLFVISQAALYRIDLDPPAGAAADQITKSLPLSLSAPEGIYFVPPSTNGTVVSTLAYGDGQVLAKGGISAPLVVRAVDSNGRPVSGVQVTFTPSAGSIVSSMSATNTGGFAQAIVKAPQEEGGFVVSVAVAGKAAASFSLRMGTSGGGTYPGGPGLSIIAGDGQVIQGGKPEIEPLTVRVTGTNGEPVAGAPVEFTVKDSLGSLLGFNCAESAAPVISCPTDANGIASAQLTTTPTDPLPAGSAFQRTTVTASVAGVGGVPNQTVTFNETWTPSTAPLQALRFDAPANMDDTITVQAGTTLQGAIQAFVSAQSVQPGPPIPKVGLMIYASANYDPTETTPAYCLGWIPLSDANGMLTCDLIVPETTAPGRYQIYAVFGGNTPVPLDLVVTAPPSVPTSVVAFSGNNLSGTAGQSLLLVGLVKDQFGKAMPNVDVQWSVVSGAATLSSPASKTGTDGKAPAGVVLGSTPGPVVVKLAAGNATAVFNLSVTVPVGEVTKGSGDGQSVIVGGQFEPVAVKVIDAQGKGIAGVSVEFKVTSGSATPMTHTAVTGADGVATATFTAPSSPSQIVVAASASGKNVTFSLSARLPGPVLTAASFLNAASMQPGISTGSLVAIKGEGLTAGLTIPPGACLTGVSDGNIQRELPTRLAGIEVRFEWTNVAPILAICKNPDGSDQINVQAPFELAPANIHVSVTTGIATAAEMTASVDGVALANAMPGIFEYNVSSTARAAVALRPDGTAVSPTNQAKRGEVIRVFTTGLGPVLPAGGVPVKTNQPGYPGQKPFFVASVQLGGSGAPGVTAEYAQNLIGIFVVTFQVPADAQINDAVPLVVSVLKNTGEIASSKASSIPISE